MVATGVEEAVLEGLGVAVCVGVCILGPGVTAKTGLGVGSGAVGVAIGSARKAAAVPGAAWRQLPFSSMAEVTNVSDITRPTKIPRSTQNFPLRQIRT